MPDTDRNRRFTLLVAMVGAAGALGLVWDGTAPGSSLLWSGLGLLLMGSAVAAWVALVVASLVRRRWRWQHLLVPLFLALTYSMVATSLPLKARWASSRAAFTDAVSELPSATVGPGLMERVRARDRIGSFPIDNAAQVERGGVEFFLANVAAFDDGAFLYLPGPAPVDGVDGFGFSAPSFTRLGGHWYAVTGS